MDIVSPAWAALMVVIKFSLSPVVWGLGVLLIGMRNQTVSIVLYIILQRF